MNKNLKVGLIVVGVIAVLFFLLVFMIAISIPTTSTNSIRIGEEGKLYQEGYTMIPVCTTKANLNELLDAAYAQDQVGYKQIIMSSKCYMASSIEPYGNILFLGRDGIGIAKVRFTHPSALHYNEAVWTVIERVVA